MSRTARTHAVIFDLDGTLVDSMPLVLRAFAHALQPACGELTRLDEDIRAPDASRLTRIAP